MHRMHTAVCALIRLMECMWKTHTPTLTTTTSDDQMNGQILIVLRSSIMGAEDHPVQERNSLRVHCTCCNIDAPKKHEDTYHTRARRCSFKRSASAKDDEQTAAATRRGTGTVIRTLPGDVRALGLGRPCAPRPLARARAVGRRPPDAGGQRGFQLALLTDQTPESFFEVQK